MADSLGDPNYTNSIYRCPDYVCFLYDIICTSSCQADSDCRDSCPHYPPCQYDISCTSSCQTDRDCRGDPDYTYKCCPRCGCNICVGTRRSVLEGGKRTIPLPFPEDTCKTRVCPPGTKCIYDPVECVKAPCPQTRCEPILTSSGVRAAKKGGKPGSCPPSSGLAGICVFNPDYNCLSDWECTGNKKCCSEGCGKICKNPV